jgi:hypothetical protein
LTSSLNKRQEVMASNIYSVAQRTIFYLEKLLIFKKIPKFESIDIKSIFSNPLPVNRNLFEINPKKDL